MKNTLIIETTHQCQLKCPWCISKDTMEGHSPYITKEDLEKVICYALDKNINEISFQGGEPLYDVKKFNALLNTLVPIFPTAKYVLFTNGINLTEDVIVRLIDLKVDVILALDARGYKGISSYLERHKEAQSIINNLNQLKHQLSIRTVIMDYDKLYSDLLTLCCIFPSASIQLVPDLSKLRELTETDMQKLYTTFTKLKEKGLLTHIHLLHGLCYKCTDTKYRYLRKTSEIVKQCGSEKTYAKGCNFFIDEVSPKIVDMYQNIVKEFKPNDNIPQ